MFRAFLLFFLIALSSYVVCGEKEKELDKLCFQVAHSAASLGVEPLYTKAEIITAQKHNPNPHWVANWFGRNLTIPLSKGNWSFNDSKIIGSLSHREPSIEITIGSPMSEYNDSEVFSTLLAEFSTLPQPDISRFELIKLAVQITPDETSCDINNVQKTINELAALSYKSYLFLKKEDKFYISPNGDVVIHKLLGSSEIWYYIFPTLNSDLPKQISIQHWEPGNYKNIGLQIYPSLSYGYHRGEPSWLSSSFFVFENNYAKSASEFKKEVRKIMEGL